MRASFAVALFLAGSSCASADGGSLRPELRPETPEVDSSLPPAFADLGRPCPKKEDWPSSMSPFDRCGKNDRVSFATMFERIPLPDGAQRLVGSRGNVFVLIERERVWVQRTCVDCRVETEETCILHLAYATDGQLRWFQFMAELPDEPTLRDAESWLAAVTTWVPRK
ncbi:hypothetical protein [Polyangium sp. 6x1]|uniref:hypothetical protein n=1 Tax=Polyangium sp. 6x1 TaxID=3042689 RepID=UPI002482B661|nr:hypothetical protein [Polyangium sp. 6x1]MDI1444013.1 hypothetical protein [Polyangium sp. 6x1]